MSPIPYAHKLRLTANGRLNAYRQAIGIVQIDFQPVTKLHWIDRPACVWLLSEINPHDPELVFALCDMGIGCPDLRYVSLFMLEEALRGPEEGGVCHDPSFVARMSIGAYAAEAYRLGRIVC